jgi:hypothetical protein
MPPNIALEATGEAARFEFVTVVFAILGARNHSTLEICQSVHALCEPRPNLL